MNTVIAPPPDVIGQKIKKGEFAGAGAGVQAIGLVVFIVGLALHWIFVPVGLVLLIIGGRMAFRFLCSECGNRVEKTSRICPHCHAHFK